jgi:hypothetical protein
MKSLASNAELTVKVLDKFLPQMCHTNGCGDCVLNDIPTPGDVTAMGPKRHEA